LAIYIIEKLISKVCSIIQSKRQERPFVPIVVRVKYDDILLALLLNQITKYFLNLALKIIVDSVLCETYFDFFYIS